MRTLAAPLMIVCVVATAAVAAEAPLPPAQSVQLQELEAARIQVSLAQRMVMDARLRLSELRLEQRVQKRLLLQSESTHPSIVPNPAWQEVSAELARRESEARQLRERLQAAHPEMQKIESELSELRSRLDTIPQLVPSPQTHSNTETLATIDFELQQQIDRAEEQLCRAEHNLQVAEEFDARVRTGIATLKAPSAPVAASPRQSTRKAETNKPKSKSDHTAYGWICLLLALGTIAVSWRRQTSRATQPAVTRRREQRRIDQPAQRIVYRCEPRVRPVDAVASIAGATADGQQRFSYSHSPRPAER